MVFINPAGDGKWCKFDDDVVSRCTKREAIQLNFGGDGEELTAVRHCTNAYMLVYIQKSRLREILAPVGQEDIPEAIADRLQEEKKLEAVRRKEKNEAHLYMTVKVILEDAFFGHQGHDLFDQEAAPYIEFRIRKAATLREFMASVAEDMHVGVERLRPWPLTYRTNQTLRPSLLELEDGERSMTEVIGVHPLGLHILPPFPPTPSTYSSVLCFFLIILHIRIRIRIYNLRLWIWIWIRLKSF